MKGANLEILGFSNGQKKADGHSGNTRVPTAEQDSACFFTSTTMETGGKASYSHLPSLGITHQLLRNQVTKIAS